MSKVINGTFKFETEKAVLLEIPNWGPEWFPLSQVRDWDKGVWEEGDIVEVEVTDFIIRKKPGVPYV